MSYWLCLSFLYHRYRGDCKIRAYADDHQVGEITLTDSIGLKTVSLEGSPVKARVQSKHPVCHVHILPEKLYMFEIQEHQLNDRITIKVDNDFNNYTNGFMTRFSHINFSQIFLVPDCLLQLKTLQKLRERIAISKDDDRWTSSKPYLRHEPKAFPDDSPSNFRFKNSSRENSEDTIREKIHPGVQSCQIMHQYQDYTDLGGTALGCTALGGSFIVDLPVSRKHQMVHLGGPPMGRPGIRMSVFRTLWAFNQLNTST